MERKIRVCDEPGKFEGELLIAIPLYHRSLEWGCDEEVGDLADYGYWYGLLRGPFYSINEIEPGVPLTKEEKEYLGRIAGVILYENSVGFVSVVYYSSPAQLERDWEELLEALSE